MSGTGNFSSAVTWYVNSVAGGNSSVGTISARGLYVAPSAINAALSVTITATSVADATKSGSVQANIVLGLVSSVTISPSSQNVTAGSSQIFTAQVQGSGNVNPNVTWYVNGVDGGNAALGTITPGPSGTYTAPDVIPSPDTVTITATSVQDSTKSGTANVAIVAPPLGIVSVSVGPTNVAMPANQTLTMTATVIGVGNFNPAVTWSVTPAGEGTISAKGVYTPPNNLSAPTSVDITATSVADPSKTADTNVQVYPLPVITQISPSAANAGDTIQISGNNLDSLIAVQFTGPNNLTLTQPWGTNVTVPFSTMTGSVSVVAQFPGFAPVVSNSLPFTRIPALRIRSANRDLSAGETTQFAYRVLGNPSPQTIQWTADAGSIDSGGNYQAPGSIGSDGFAHIQGCIAGTQVCQSEILGLHPFRIASYPASVALGSSLQLDATIGGITTSATWTQWAGGGSLTPGGLYTAGFAMTDGGGVPITATANGATESTTVGVTGAFPGMISEISDYVDYTLPTPLGTDYEQVAVAGNRLYALASDSYSQSLLNRTYFWIDVYDISDPVHPVWIDAVESASRAPMYTRGNYLYQISPDTVITSGTIAVFDLSGGTPALIAQSPLAVGFTQFSYSDGIVDAVTGVSSSGDQETISQFDLRGGGIIRADFQLPVPNAAAAQQGVWTSAVGTDTRMFVFNTANPYSSSQAIEVDTFDLTTNPPTLLQTQPLSMPLPPNFRFNGAGSLFGNLLIGGGIVFDVSSGVPVQVGTFPGPPTGNFSVPGPAVWSPLAFNGKQLLMETVQQGFRVVDLSNPAQPSSATMLFDGTSVWESAAWAGTNVVTANGPLHIFDEAPLGGGVDSATPLGPFSSSAVLDQLVYGSHLYEAVQSDVGAFVSVVDLNSNPPAEVGRFDTATANPYAVQAASNNLYVGTDQSLLVLDISIPASPTQVASLPLQVLALAESDPYLYVGTADGHLMTYNISQPSVPSQVSSQLLPAPPVFIRTANNLLLVADDTSGLLIYSLANPSSPALLSQFQAGTSVGDVAVDGNVALLSTWDQGLVTLDITNPAVPVQLGQAVLPDYGITNKSGVAGAISVSNKVAYVGTWFNSDIVYGFDYTTPSHPRMISVMPEGQVVCEQIFTLQNNGTGLFVGGLIDDYPVIDIDISQPRNVINFYPLFASALPAEENTCLSGAAASRAEKTGRTQTQTGVTKPSFRRHSLRQHP